MQVRNSLIKTKFSIVILWSIALFTSCSDDMSIDRPFGDLSGEGIRFGVSKGASSWEPDSRALQSTQSIALPCISNDETFGVSVMVKEKQSPDFKTLSRGTQFTQNDTLKTFDVVAYRYKDNDKDTQLYFAEKVNDGAHTSGNTYYWLYEDKIDFMAFAPQNVFTLPTADIYNQDEITFSYSIDADEQKHRDIMVASAKGLDYDDAGYPVRLDFKHLLASVRFVVGKMSYIQIDSLRIKNVWGGDLNFIFDKNKNLWTNSIPTAKMTFYPHFESTSLLSEGDEISGNINNATLFMAPQTLPSDATIEVVYTELLTGEQGSGTAKIGGTQWDAGKDYAYAFNIGTTFNVTIPKPSDQDAHYVIFKMDYNLGTMSSEVTDVQAQAFFLDDGSNTASSDKWNITLKNSLTPTQLQGYFTDEQWKMAYKINDDGSKDPPNPPVTKVGSIVGESTLPISNNSGSIYLLLDENNGTTDRNGVLVFTAKVRRTNQTIVIGWGPFKQLSPSWNNSGVGIERIEDANLYPYGFNYSRKVTYTNTLATQNWGIFLDWLRKLILFFTGSTVEQIIPDSENMAEGFVITQTTTIASRQIVSSVTLDYSALNNVQEVASDDNGLNNTKALYNFTGDTDISELENQLDVNLNDWKRTVENEGVQPEDYAAYIALSRNRMRELRIEITGKNANQQTEVTILHKAILHEDANGNEIIEWYLPSSDEAKSLKDTGTSSQGISPLSGTYWSSTAGDDANAWSHSYSFSNNRFGAINEKTSRMSELKVRAVRKKSN